MTKLANRFLSFWIGGQFVALVALSIGASLFVVPTNEAMAANGECVWEGGDGAPSYPYCEAEDCIGEGGLAQCSAGIAAPPLGVSESLLGGDKWLYRMCWEGPGTTGTAATWCEAGGGTWDPWAIECTDFQDGVLGITATNSESLATQISDAFIDDKYGTGSCGTTLVSDSGWGQTLNSNFCYIGSPNDTLDILTLDFRQREYERTGGGSCIGTATVQFRRDRTAVCPDGYKSRTATSGQQCYIPAECSMTCAGNPVSVVTGTKFHREDDYVVGAETGIEFSRFYKSTGYYWPAQVYPLVAIPGGLKAEDVWRHSYDQRLSSVTGNSEVMAILQRADGSLQVFDTNGDEVTNRTSSGAEIAEVSGVGWDITQDDGTVERYNTDGKLLSITKQSGQVTTLTYTSGKLTGVTGPFGHSLSLSYDGDGHLETLTLPDSGTITYAYDGLGRAVSVTYDDDTTKEYLYEDSNNGFLLTGIIDENEVEFATYEYDSTGRVIAEEHAGGVESYSFSYGALGQPTAVTDPLGTTTNHGFAVAAGMYRPATYSQPCMSCGSAASTTYDANGNPDVRTDYEGNQIKYTFDSSRNLETSRIEAYGTALARTISTQWHTTFRLPIQISEPGRQTDLTYDSNGNLLTVTVTDTATSAYRIWTHTYNGLGQVLSVDGPLSGSTDTTTFTYYNCSGGAQCGQVASMTDAANNTTDFLTYNAHGLPLTVSDANGTVTTLTYDDRQRVTSSSVGTKTTTVTYWPTGLVKKETYPDGSYFEYDYDDAQRLIGISDTAGNRIAYTLDAAGNRIAETIYDSLENVISTGTRDFDGLGRLEEAVGSDSQTASFTYDLNGNVLTDQDPYGRITTYTYDTLNRAATTEDWFDGLTTFAYDDNDNLLSVTDPRGLVTSYAYNGFGDAISLTSPDTGASTTTRDAAGYIDVATDARSEAGDYSFDGLGRITGVAYGDQTIQYAYDGGTYGAGLLTGLTDGSGSTGWTYDALGRVILREQTTGSIDLDTAYSFNSYGQLASLTTPSGQVIGYSYDSSGRVTGISVNSSTLISQIGYEPLGPPNGWTWGNSSTTTRTYDTDGQLVYLSSAGESSTFTFYDDGRIATRTDSDPVSVAISTGSTTFSTSGTSNRLTSTTGLIARTYSYDATGNTLSDGTASFGYDDSGRMVSATVGASTTTYDHNGFGERVKKSDGSTTAYFAYDEVGHLIGEYDANGDLIQETVWFGDIPVATLQPDGQSGVDVFYVHPIT